MSHKFIPLTNDRMFKAILSSKEARDYLSDIILGIKEGGWKQVIVQYFQI